MVLYFFALCLQLRVFRRDPTHYGMFQGILGCPGLGCSRPGACFSNCSDSSSAPESRFVFAFKIKVSNINFENHIRLSVNEAKLTGF